MKPRPHRRLTWLKHRIEAMAFILLNALAARLPLAVHGALARVWAVAAFDLLRIRRRATVNNLSLAFPEKSDAERRRIARGAYAHAYLSVAEFARLSRPKAMAAAVELEGEEHYLELTRRGRAFVVVASHLGNWEFMPHYLGTRGLAMTILYKPMHNPILDAKFLEIRRACAGEFLSTRLPERELWRRLVEAVRRKSAIGFLADQDARGRGIFVPFLGHPASTATGPATLALRHSLPILPAHCFRLAPGRFRVVFDQPIEPPPGGRTAENVEALTRHHVESLERAIRAAPEQYFWLHRRWKTQPKTGDKPRGG